MKILQINKFFHPQGGTETHLFNLIDLLEDNDQEVLLFSQNHPSKTLDHQDKKYFINDIDLSQYSFKNIFEIGRIFWSFKASRLVKQLINDRHPDIVHIHNIYHQISPSILPTIKRAGIPIVMTVHDFKLIKPNYVIETGKSKRHKNSRMADLLLKAEFIFHKKLNIYQKNVDLFIAPSNFVRNQLINHGFNPNKITVLPHFVKATTKIAKNDDVQPYITAFGRLDENKGFDTLIKAMSKIKNKSIKLKIIGRGSDLTRLNNLIDQYDLRDHVSLIDWQTPENLQTIINQSLFTVIPSKAYETFGLTVLESYQNLKPVIVANRGALPEIVEVGKTGLLFEPENSQELANKIDLLSNDQELIKKMKENIKEYIKKFNSNDYYANINNIYQKLIKK
jgi:glycosyltransferase involved in cell wall biosynthesis